MAYFTKETDESIDRFQDSQLIEEKHKIFDREIRPAFEKLIESLIYVYGFWSLGDVETLKRECLTDLYGAVEKYDSSKSNNPSKTSSKAFSYFNMVAKNWFFARSRDNNKKNKNESELYYGLDHESLKNDPNFIVSHHEEAIENKEKWLDLYKNMDLWRDRVKKKNDKQVVDAIIFIMKNAELVSIYNKKAVYLYLRDLTGLTAKQIVVALKSIRELYIEWRKEYHSNGTLESFEEDENDEENE